MKNVFYHKNINSIGGIETFYYRLAQIYESWDITIIYKTCDPLQLARLERYVRLIKYNPEIKIKCEKAFFNFNTDIIDNIDAREYGLIIHGDYRTLLNLYGMHPPIHKKIDKYYGVSKTVCRTFNEITGKKAELIYNPFRVEKPKKILRLISATRLTREKGKDRIIKLAKAFDEAHIPFEWNIFTNDINAIKHSSIIYRKPKLNLTNEIAAADYLVQLSDSEAYCYSTAEANALGTPVIITDLECFKELGNIGYTLQLDMGNIPVDSIYNDIPKVEWEAPKDKWEKILAEGASDYAKERKKMPKVKALDTYKKLNIKDAGLNRIPEAGEVFTVTKDRLAVLLGKNPHNKAFVTELKEAKSQKKKTKKPTETNTEEGEKDGKRQDNI